MPSISDTARTNLLAELGLTSSTLSNVDLMKLVHDQSSINHISNSDFEVNIVGWSPSGGTTLSQSTAQAKTGNNSLRILNGPDATNADSLIVYSDYISVPVGRQSIHSAWIFSATATTARMNIQQDNAAGTVVLTIDRGPITAIPANTWTKIEHISTTPTGGGNVRCEPGVAMGPSVEVFVDLVVVNRYLTTFTDASDAVNYWQYLESLRP